jgi:hypothetical protein
LINHPDKSPRRDWQSDFTENVMMPRDVALRAPTQKMIGVAELIAEAGLMHLGDKASPALYEDFK